MLWKKSISILAHSDKVGPTCTFECIALCCLCECGWRKAGFCFKFPSRVFSPLESAVLFWALRFLWQHCMKYDLAHKRLSRKECLANGGQAFFPLTLLDSGGIDAFAYNNGSTFNGEPKVTRRQNFQAQIQDVGQAQAQSGLPPPPTKTTKTEGRFFALILCSAQLAWIFLLSTPPPSENRTGEDPEKTQKNPGYCWILLLRCSFSLLEKRFYLHDLLQIFQTWGSVSFVWIESWNFCKILFSTPFVCEVNGWTTKSSRLSCVLTTSDLSETSNLRFKRGNIRKEYSTIGIEMFWEHFGQKPISI